MQESIKISPETIEAILKIMGEPINSLTRRMGDIEKSNDELAKEIHSTLRHLDMRYTEAEKLVERAENEAGRAIEAAKSVNEKVRQCREDEEKRTEASMRRIFPEILKVEFPIILSKTKQKTDWGKNISIILGCLVLAASIFAGVNTVVTDKVKVAQIERTLDDHQSGINELKVEVKKIKE